ncbi:hypothetical protein ACFSJW_06805 [Flavobacterium artemisiae]|uniref:Uncharacterized protein n=1 Tax=Flavobacterium artemisiae TaxID=2126556 RepID=A0ABW4HD97_9FLAO
MLEYDFYKNESGRDCLYIKGKLEGLNELASCSISYLEEIVDNLTKLIEGEIATYDFGFEVHSVDCTKEICKVIDTYDGWKEIAQISTPAIYRLMQVIKKFVISNENYVHDDKKRQQDTIASDSPLNEFLFFDGVKTYLFKEQHFDWLYSSDYNDWVNSYVEIGNKRINIIQENVKVLSTFKFFKKEELELLAQKFNLKIREKDAIYYAYSQNHDTHQFEISENEALIVIYCLEGSRAPESIFIYKIIEK